MAPDPALADRIMALDCLDPSTLADVLAAMPHVTHSLGSSDTRNRLAALLADPKMIRMTIEMLSPQAFQLLMVANAHGGVMSPEQVRRETEPIGDARAAAIVDELVARVLAEPSHADLVLRPGVGEIVRAPGRSFATMVEFGSINSEELEQILRRHRVPKPPTRKADRIRRVLEIMADREAVQAALDTMTPVAQELFAHLVDAGVAGSNASVVGIQTFELSLIRYATYGRHVDRVGLGPTGQAVLDLRSFGLILVDPYDGGLWVWREVLQSVAGRLVNHWPASWDGQPVAFHETMVRPPQSPSAMAVVLQRVRAEPIVGLKSGGVGVKTFREIARRSGQVETTVALMFDLAERLGLVEEHSQLVGRGRAAAWQYRYSISIEALAAFEDLPAVDQWRHIVAAWVGGPVHSADGPFTAFVLRQVLADLVALAPDQAIAEADFVRWIELRHIVAANFDLARIADHLRALDLVEPTGPVALTPLARAVLTDPRSVPEMLPPLDDRFVVQADHTVMAPPSLDPMIRTRLESIATLVSDGGMRVYRLDAGRIAHALAAGESADDLVEFLADTSTVALPDAVSRLIHDTDRRRGGLRVAAAATVVTATDVLGLAAALKVTSARLTLVAPTVAISELSPARVATALRAKGLAPTTSGVTIALDGRSAVPQPSRTNATTTVGADAGATNSGSTDVAGLVLGPDALASIAKAVTG